MKPVRASLSLSLRAQAAVRSLVADEVRLYMRAAKHVPEQWRRAEALARNGRRIRTRVLHRHQHRLISQRVLRSLERRARAQDRHWWPGDTGQDSTDNPGALMLALQAMHSRLMGKSATQRLLGRRHHRAGGLMPIIVLGGDR